MLTASAGPVLLNAQRAELKMRQRKTFVTPAVEIPTL